MPSFERRCASRERRRVGGGLPDLAGMLRGPGFAGGERVPSKLVGGIDVRELGIGNGSLQEGAEGLPAIGHAIDQETPGWDRAANLLDMTLEDPIACSRSPRRPSKVCSMMSLLVTARRSRSCGRSWALGPRTNQG
jgi:hypothetical protein